MNVLCTNKKAGSWLCSDLWGTCVHAMQKMLSGEHKLPLHTNWGIDHLSACESGFVYIWEVPDGGLTDAINTPSVVLKGLSNLKSLDAVTLLLLFLNLQSVRLFVCRYAYVLLLCLRWFSALHCISSQIAGFHIVPS